MKKKPNNPLTVAPVPSEPNKFPPHVSVRDLDHARKESIYLVAAVYATVKDMGAQGAPAGPMYMALMQKGYGLGTFETIMAALEQAKLVTKKGDVYYAQEEKA